MQNIFKPFKWKYWIYPNDYISDINDTINELVIWAEKENKNIDITKIYKSYIKLKIDGDDYIAQPWAVGYMGTVHIFIFKDK